jgi:hypothetical protein
MVNGVGAAKQEARYQAMLAATGLTLGLIG